MCLFRCICVVTLTGQITLCTLNCQVYDWNRRAEIHGEYNNLTLKSIIAFMNQLFHVETVGFYLAA